MGHIAIFCRVVVLVDFEPLFNLSGTSATPMASIDNVRQYDFLLLSLAMQQQNVPSFASMCAAAQPRFQSVDPRCTTFNTRSLLFWVTGF